MAQQLTPYRGRDVLRTSLAIRRAGDGLSAALGIDPVEYEPGSKVYVVLECEAGEHTHKPIPDTEAFELKQVFLAGAATVVDADLVAEQLQTQKERIQAAEDAAKGVQQLIPSAEGHRIKHELGEHAAGIVEGCPECQSELDQMEAEREADASVQKQADDLATKRRRRAPAEPKAE